MALIVFVRQHCMFCTAAEPASTYTLHLWRFSLDLFDLFTCFFAGRFV
jgi:hypothetical protein